MAHNLTNNAVSDKQVHGDCVQGVTVTLLHAEQTEILTRP